MKQVLDDDIVTALGQILDGAPVPTARPMPPRPLGGAAVPEYAIDLADRRLVSQHRLVFIAAASILLALGGLAVLKRGPSTVGVGPAASSSSVVESSSSTAPSTETTAVPAAPLSSYTGWYMPTFIPDGYEISTVEAYRPPTTPTTVPTERVREWARLNASGAVAATVNVSVSPVQPPDPLKPVPVNTRVRGNPALSFDSGEGIVVSWQEAGWQLAVRGIALSEQDLQALADASTLDAATGTLTLTANSGFAPVDVPEATSGKVVGVGIGLLRSDGAPGGIISFSSSPNGEGETLEGMKFRLVQTQKTSSEIRRIGDSDRLVQTRESAEFGSFVDVTWIENGMLMAVGGRAGPGEVLKMAESVHAVDPQQLIEEGRRITDRLLARKTLESVSLADGTVLSVKTQSNGPVALCVESPIVVCRWQIGDGSLSGNRLDAVFDSFDVAGRTLLFGWHEAAGQPTLDMSHAIAPPGGAAPTSTATFAEIKQTALGHFIEVVVPPGEQPPMISYGTSSYGVGDRSDTTLLRF
jgi:hypothetical protein